MISINIEKHSYDPVKLHKSTIVDKNEQLRKQVVKKIEMVFQEGGPAMVVIERYLPGKQNHFTLDDSGDTVPLTKRESYCITDNGEDIVLNLAGPFHFKEKKEKKRQRKNITPLTEIKRTL